MIDRQHNRIVIACDTSGCTEAHEGEPGAEFAEVWAKAKDEGWRTRKIAGEWLHGCPDCGAPT